MLPYCPVHRIRNCLEFVPTKAGRDEDDAGVLGVPRDRVVSQRVWRRIQTETLDPPERFSKVGPGGAASKDDWAEGARCLILTRG